MNEMAYRAYCDRGKKALDLYNAVKTMYGSLTLREAYFRAIKDGVLTKEDRSLLREFYTI